MWPATRSTRTRTGATESWCAIEVGHKALNSEELIANTVRLRLRRNRRHAARRQSHRRRTRRSVATPLTTSRPLTCPSPRRSLHLRVLNLRKRPLRTPHLHHRVPLPKHKSNSLPLQPHLGRSHPRAHRRRAELLGPPRRLDILYRPPRLAEHHEHRTRGSPRGV